MWKADGFILLKNGDILLFHHMGTHLKTYTDVLPMSTHNMFSARNKNSNRHSIIGLDKQHFLV